MCIIHPIAASDPENPQPTETMYCTLANPNPFELFSTNEEGIAYPDGTPPGTHQILEIIEKAVARFGDNLAGYLWARDQFCNDADLVKQGASDTASREQICIFWAARADYDLDRYWDDMDRLNRWKNS